MNALPFDIVWPKAPASAELCGRDVHVWAASLATTPDRVGFFSELLSSEENERARRFRFELHRNRFIVGRALLRILAGAYLQRPARELVFVCNAHGKPELPPGGAELHFNLSHSGDLALLAFSRLGPLGVDVECVRPMKDADDLVARFFSPRESSAFHNLASDQKPAAFFNLWTRKEALLKATGLGISGGLNRVEVTFLPEEPAQLIEVPEGHPPAADWTLEALTPAFNWTAALAMPHRDLILHLYRWEDERSIR